MSIYINKDNRLVIVSSAMVTADEHLNRMKGLIELVQQRGDDFTHSEPVYEALSLLEDMLPNEQQLQKMLK